jgi:hypothetical protein
MGERLCNVLICPLDVLILTRKDTIKPIEDLPIRQSLEVSLVIEDSGG